MYWILFDFPLRNSQCHCCGRSGELRGGYHSGTVKAIVEMAPRLRVWGCVPFLCPHCYTRYAESDRSLAVLGGEKQVETEAEAGGSLQVWRREWLCTQAIFSFLGASRSQEGCKEGIIHPTET